MENTKKYYILNYERTFGDIWWSLTKITKIFFINTYSFFRSAFFWFAADERPKVRAANPSFAVGDIAKELGKRWAEFGPTFKQKYEAKAEKDRERYVNAKQDFQQMLKDEKNGMHLFCLLIYRLGGKEARQSASNLKMEYQVLSCIFH